MPSDHPIHPGDQLFAVKLHSGRKPDSSDLVLLAADADFERVESHLHRGDTETLAGRIESVLDRLTSEDFEDAFNDVFEQQTVPDEDCTDVVTFLRDQQRRLDTNQ